jgi:hypothetical protein
MRPGEQPPADVVPEALEAPEDTTEVIEVSDRDGGAPGAEDGGAPSAGPETPTGA